MSARVQAPTIGRDYLLIESGKAELREVRSETRSTAWIGLRRQHGRGTCPRERHCIFVQIVPRPATDCKTFLRRFVLRGSRETPLVDARHPEKLTNPASERVVSIPDDLLSSPESDVTWFNEKINEDLHEALSQSDLARAASLVQAGASVNARTRFGDSLLAQIAGHHDTTVRRDGVIFLLECGADPRLLDPDGGGPLFSAVIAWDVVVLKLLLDAGADPNDENEPGETLFEWAKFDYGFEVWNCGMQWPEEPTEADKVSPDSWLDFLDRIALKYGKPRPDSAVASRARNSDQC